MKEPIVIQDLNYKYDTYNVLEDLTLSFKENKLYSIIGPNGSGKTTLLKNILSILQVNKNCIYIDSKDIKSYRALDLAKKISYVPQNTNIDFDFTAYEVVLMGRSAYINRFSEETKADREIARRAMEKTKVWDMRDVNVNNLSGGEQQRVFIARAIAQDTQVILLDEPISHLDICHQIQIMDCINTLKENKTVIAVLHDLNLAAQYSDEVILINIGKIKIQGSPEEVLTQDLISDVYKLKVSMLKDPNTGKPHIIPLANQFI
jgi:iron complex transport system ATP-binding protein